VTISAILGTQWGDEGKGRFVDQLAAQADYVVRFQGGHNAGHTIVVDGESYALRLTPSGVLHSSCIPVIANGVVVNPFILDGELTALAARGVDVSRVVLSTNAHLILPVHQAMDAAQEQLRGDSEIGTTKSGNGPAYAAKMSRHNIRAQDLAHPALLSAQLAELTDEATRQMKALGVDLPDLTEDNRRLVEEIAPRLAPRLTDTVNLLHNARRAGKHILLEGAQAAMLDIDHGTYPYVTSSNTTAGGASTGTGLGPKYLDRLIGVAKAYCTRVGAGPYPTELTDEIGDGIVDRGHEFGVNTKRRRRPGWFDAVQVRHVAQVNSLDELWITKLDVLDPLAEVKIGVGYELDGERIDYLPGTSAAFARVNAVFETLPGWQSDLSKCRSRHDLPVNAQRFIERLGELVGLPIGFVGVGPGRDEVVEW
jgi:adenylosuccinate synthase